MPHASTLTSCRGGATGGLPPLLRCRVVGGASHPVCGHAQHFRVGHLPQPPRRRGRRRGPRLRGRPAQTTVASLVCVCVGAPTICMHWRKMCVSLECLPPQELASQPGLSTSGPLPIWTLQKFWRFLVSNWSEIGNCEVLLQFWGGFVGFLHPFFWKRISMNFCYFQGATWPIQFPGLYAANLPL